MKLIFIVVLASFLNGCSWISDYLSGDENIEPPKELVDIKNAIPVTQLWSNDIGKGSGEQLLRLTPVIQGQFVYVASRDGQISAYQLNDGDLQWAIETKYAITAGPAVGAEYILVGTRDADVIAYQLADGKELWSVKVSGEVLSVPEMNSDTAIIRTVDGRITALNLSNGEKRWDFQNKEPALTLRGTSKPIIYQDQVISGFDNGKLYSVSLEDGRQIWSNTVAVPRGRTELERIVDLDADPVIANGVVYAAAYQANIAAISISQGQLLWQRDLSSFNGMDISGEHLFVTDNTSQVWSLHINNGASLWRQDAMQHRLLTAPIVHQDYVVVGDFEGYLHWLRKDDGKIVARLRGDSKGFAVNPVVVGDTLVSLGKSGELTAFRLQSAR